MLRGQRSQVRKGGGEGVPGASLRRLPGQARKGLTPARGEGGQGAGWGWGRVWGMGLFYCIWPPALGRRHSFSGETKDPQSWRPAPLGGRFAPRTRGIPLAEGSGHSSPGEGGESAERQDLPPTLSD